MKTKSSRTRNQQISFISVAKAYLNSRVVSNSHEKSVIRAAKRVKYLDSELLNKYLKSVVDKKSSHTVKHSRSILLSLWKYAYENNIINHLPKNIIKIKQKRKPTEAWTIDQCEYIVKKTFEKDSLKLKNGVSIGVFLRCWLLLGYESGARKGDIFGFKYSNLDDNILRWTMSKTGDPMTKILSPKTMQAIEDLKSYNINEDDRILGWVISSRRSLSIMKQHIKDCGLSGTSKYLRRSGATHIEIDHPGYAKFHLGHRTSGLAEKNYIDFAQINQHIPPTPVLLQ